MHIHSFNNEAIIILCAHIMHIRIRIYRCQSCTVQRDFKGGVYWDELAEMYGDISRVVGI